MSDLTEAQLGWLAEHPQYCFPGPPRPGLTFHESGTLYTDGRFEPMAPMKAIKLEPGCRLVGIPSDLYLTGAPAATNLSATQAVAEWMMQHGYATGHGDTLDDLLTELVAHAALPRS